MVMANLLAHNTMYEKKIRGMNSNLILHLSTEKMYQLLTQSIRQIDDNVFIFYIFNRHWIGNIEFNDIWKSLRKKKMQILFWQFKSNEL